MHQHHATAHTVPTTMAPHMPGYTGLFIEPVYADGQPYRRPEDDDADQSPAAPIGVPIPLPRRVPHDVL